MQKIKEYLLITIGVALTAIALEYFFFPCDIAAGGVSGIGLVINKVFGLDTSVVILVLNIVLFALAFVVLGKGFGAKSIYATIMLSVFMWIIENVFKPTVLTENMFLASVFGSIILGMGAAIVFHQDASTGGTSIIAAIISKFTPIGIGISVLLTDSFVCMAAISVFGIDKGLFGFFSVILIGLIIAAKEKEIVNHIIKNIDRGCTVLNGNGGYTGSDIKVIYTVLSTKEFIELKKSIKNIDPNAFLTVNESTEVLGKGFTEY